MRRLTLMVAMGAVMAGCGGGGGGSSGGTAAYTSPFQPLTATTLVADGGTVRLLSRNADGSPASDEYAAFTFGSGPNAFASRQSDLVPDTNGLADVFTVNGDGTIRARVSVTDDGAEADGPSGIIPELPGNTNLSQSTVSAYQGSVAFVSDATNLVSVADSNGVPDVYVRKTAPSGMGRTYRASLSASNVQPDQASFSPVMLGEDSVAFVTASALVATDTNHTYDVYLKELSSGNLTLLSRPGPGLAGNGASFDPQACLNGVCFLSWADNLVPDDHNGSLDLFVYDLSTRSMRRLSTDGRNREADKGLLGPAHAGEIRFPGRLYDVSDMAVAFLSESTNLVADDTNGRLDAFVKDMHYLATQSGANPVVRLSVNYGNTASGATLNGIGIGGWMVAFTSDQPLTGKQTPGSDDVYLRTFQALRPDGIMTMEYPSALLRISNPLTDSWPMARVDRIQEMASGAIVFAGGATPAPGTTVNGLFMATLP